MSELEQYIQATFNVDKKDLNEINQRFKPEKLKKGDFYLKEGQQSDKISFVQSGMIRIFVETEEKSVTQWISTKGYFITDLASFVFHTPARWNMQALTPCELFTISREEYTNLSAIIPHWSTVDKLFIARCFILLEDRIFGHLSMSAEERYHHLFSRQPDLFNQVPLQYLASMLGMTPETLSRLRKRL